MNSTLNPITIHNILLISPLIQPSYNSLFYLSSGYSIRIEWKSPFDDELHVSLLNQNRKSLDIYVFMSGIHK